MKKKDAKRKMPPAGIIVLLLMLAGLALILYPGIAGKYNQMLNRRLITDYREKVQAIDESRQQDMLAAAREYNAALALHTPYIGELTAENRKIYESLLDITGTGIMGYIEVKKSGIYLAVYHGTGEDILQTAAGHLEASSLPVTGESVHTVLTGHSGLPSARLFTDLDRLKKGDIFTLYVLNETLTYEVEDIRRVKPEALEDLHIEKGQELCTLMTCTPYGLNTHRLVVTGRRIETPQAAEKESSPAARAVTSSWNRWFIFLPVLLFAGIVAAAWALRRKKKKD